jgi:hypothetical protein
MIVLDFSKAFDKVPHQRLVSKLDHYGIRGYTLKWITSFFVGRTQAVTMEGKQSTSVEVLSGVPQGSRTNFILIVVKGSLSALKL